MTQQEQRLRSAVRRARAAKRPPHALPGGRGANLHPRDVPYQTLLRGARVEMEHGYKLAGDGIFVHTFDELLRRGNEYFKQIEKALKERAPEYSRSRRKEKKSGK